MKILIYSPNWIGDAVMAIPMVRQTRTVFPDAEITVFARDWVAPVYRFVGEIDNIVEFSREEVKTSKSRRRIIKSLKVTGYDKAFLLTDSFSTAMTIFRARIPERVGYTGQFRSWMLTNRYSLKTGKSMHRSDKYCHLLSDYSDSISMGNSPEFDSLGNEEIQMPQGWDNAAIRIGVNPHSVATSRRWPEKNWIQLFDSYKDAQVQFIIFGGNDAREAGERLRESSGANVLNLAGETSLGESIRLMGQCQLFVSNDSGPMHIADAAGVPTVGLWGAGNTESTGLRSSPSVNLNADVYCSPCEKNQCINDDEPLLCMYSISPEWVRDTMDDLLESSTVN
ncbi:MAG: lipopolysaccharide heptosyltransferase II [Candidatus Marinimicrobia bacterium]|nr:lipopolysaccharide heptosyltransferase II [Candidatus Neomarinimicrobiota bacterium]MCF7829239.1 lipopolysaccharide heptosyltransferase II [Candidatus Neomarinimicrobiota bacterium]MCF7881108.1 lipopolysaccharide heptosyltransferase II [Candidatus Neomarinimicrobiota bacterium]